MSRTIKAGHVYRQYSKDGMPIADYKSSRLAHEATGVSLGSIARAAHGERKTGGRLSVACSSGRPALGTDPGGLKQQDRIP